MNQLAQIEGERKFQSSAVQTVETLALQMRKQVYMSSALVLVLFLSVSFFLMLIVLQVVGLYAAFKGYLFDGSLTASWCSPAFLIGGEAYLNSPD